MLAQGHIHGDHPETLCVGRGRFQPLAGLLPPPELPLAMTQKLCTGWVLFFSIIKYSKSAKCCGGGAGLLFGYDERE